MRGGEAFQVLSRWLGRRGVGGGDIANAITYYPMSSIASCQSLRPALKLIAMREGPSELGARTKWQSNKAAIDAPPQ
jgi:hypothetical protein